MRSLIDARFAGCVGRALTRFGLAAALVSVVGSACTTSKPEPPPARSFDAAPRVIDKLDASAAELRELDREIALDRSEPEPTPEPAATPAFDVELDKGPAEILAWRRDPNPKTADQAWAKVWLTDSAGKRTSLPPRAAFAAVRAIQRHLLTCQQDSKTNPALAASRPWFNALGNWPTSSANAPSRRVEVFLRDSPLTGQTTGGPLEAWSLLIPIDESGARAVATSSGDKRRLLDDCSPCELADSPLGKHLSARQQQSCAAMLKARWAQPKAIEPEHAQKSWVAYLASAELPTDKRLRRAARDVAKLGYNALTTNAACDTSNFASNHMYMMALYFESKKDAQAFAKLRKPLFVGPVQTLCLD